MFFGRALRTVVCLTLYKGKFYAKSFTHVHRQSLCHIYPSMQATGPPVVTWRFLKQPVFLYPRLGRTSLLNKHSELIGIAHTTAIIPLRNQHLRRDATKRRRGEERENFERNVLTSYNTLANTRGRTYCTEPHTQKHKQSG